MVKEGNFQDLASQKLIFYTACMNGCYFFYDRICQQYIPTREYNLKEEIDSYTTSSYNSICDRLFNLVVYMGPVVLVLVVIVCAYLAAWLI